MDIIDLGIGDPDLPVDSSILEKLTEAVHDPKNLGYPSYSGCMDLREAIASFYEQRYHVSLDPESEVLILIGSKEGLGHLVPALVDPGEAVLIPDPGYPAYRMAASLANAVPYGMPLSEANDYQPDFQEIPDSIKSKAKLMFLSYPSNPTAATVDLSFFNRCVAFAKKNRCAIAHDAAYQMITFNGYRAPSLLEADGAKEVAVEFGSFSKTFCMTGFRIGYAVGNRDIIRALSICKSNLDTGQFIPIQKAAAFALKHRLGFAEKINAVFEKRMRIMIEGLSSLDISVSPTKGSFYLWAPVPGGYRSMDFTTRLMERSGVVVSPGNAFGDQGEGYFRIALTVSDRRLREAVLRMKKGYRAVVHE
ncbi:aminotransferase class I/II-fold pyridoxal phosphate-dependent enzyme [Sporolactobacillus sp. THM7-7]|nr:aminotransferase class I/II-fold pyridoxal phosphate-dependent enzyme [Sporolactobacillus sp. THM7-7]